MKVAVLRPEPGNAATAARLEALGLATLRLPLFTIAPVAWRMPDPATFDALLLTSANAVRHAGNDLAALAALPIVAVGAATAAAARGAGFTVAVEGKDDARAAVEAAATHGFVRLLHLAGREHVADLPVATVVVYASVLTQPAPVALASLVGNLTLLHSERAARYLRSLLESASLNRYDMGLAALSPAIAAAAGDGWRTVASAPRPTDTALVELAAKMVEPR